MRHTWTLTLARMRLALRNRIFMFFSIIMPVSFLFLYLGLFGHGNKYAAPFLLAEVLAVTVMGTFWGLSVQLVMFREQGILRRFHVAPVSATAMLTSSILSNYILTMPIVVLQFALARWIFHLPYWGNLTGIFLMATLGTISFASLGLIIASVTNSMQETQVINQVIWFIFLFLAGATIPLPILPGFIQSFACYLPATYLVSGFQRAMIDHAGASGLVPEIVSLAGCTVIAFVVAAQLFRWDPDVKAAPRAKFWVAVAIIPFLLLGAWESKYGRLRGNALKDFQSMEQPGQHQVL